MTLLRTLAVAGILASGLALATPAHADTYVDFGVSTGGPCGCGTPVVVRRAPVYYAAPRYYAPTYYYTPTYYTPTYYAPRYYPYYRPYTSSYVGLSWSSHSHRHHGWHGHHGSRRSLSGRRVIGTRR
ncbi:MAG: hypothetical protein AB7T63_16755 [Planctomycetota bacterium]